jgi:hypothetical protein
MNEILAVAQAPEHDDALIAQLSRRDADRVTVLVSQEVAEGPEGEQRLAELVSRAEWVTGGVAVGLAAPAEALDGCPFETVVHASGVRRRWRLRPGSRDERASGIALRPALR